MQRLNHAISCVLGRHPWQWISTKSALTGKKRMRRKCPACGKTQSF